MNTLSDSSNIKTDNEKISMDDNEVYLKHNSKKIQAVVSGAILGSSLGGTFIGLSVGFVLGVIAKTIGWL